MHNCWRWKVFVALLLVASVVGKVFGESGTESAVRMEQSYQQILLRYLFTNYDRDIHPGGNNPVVVTFGAKLGRIAAVDEKNNVVLAHWYLKQWVNPSLSWNASEFGGVNTLHVEPDRLWVPDIVLYNNADPKNDLAGGFQYKTKIEMQADGTMIWLAPAMFHSACPMDIRYFPFDEQSCDLQFASWMYDTSKLEMKIDANETKVMDTFTNKEWEIPKLTIKKKRIKYTCCPNPYEDVTITMSLVRRPYYYIMNMIFPCSLIACMTYLTFILPAESGERISLCITVLMAMSIFQELTSNKLPPSSETFFLLGVYYTVTISAIGLGLAATCIVINFYYKKTEMPQWMKVLMLGALADILRVERTYLYYAQKQKISSQINMDSSFLDKIMDGTENSCPDELLSNVDDQEDISDERESIQLENGVKHRRSPIVRLKFKKKAVKKQVVSSEAEDTTQAKMWEEEWKTASRVVDRLSLCIGLLLGLCATASIFLQAPRIRAYFTW
ncbi:neuronal acetylcholine receptor subunit alpha-3 isoform X2 [Nematostella vectensis]|uniref:neuronal acetylcholine receptor subunit alpha-3 isoform X2 n=1 Tax=Nematostella vectensis TaxID=45351 RepID=UPI0020777F30|nr:neuronal acetylcholine receptor subunit alpha-3 isoform X2 [Nematostella vectensis]